MRKTIGQVFKKAREDAGLSLRDVSRLTGMSPSQISQLENGLKPRPEFSTVVRLARGLKISLDLLASDVFGESSAVKSKLAPSEIDQVLLMNQIEAAKSGIEKIAEQLGTILGSKKLNSKSHSKNPVKKSLK